MVRITGSRTEENALTTPTGELFSSVVRRRRGKSAKRISGTESSPPTKTEPTPNKAPRKERLFSRDDPAAEGCSVIAAESPMRGHIEFLCLRITARSEPAGRASVDRPVPYFCFGNSRMYATSDVITSAERF